MSVKQKIFINISEIASYIGQNKWDYITPFERIWKKCDKEFYENALKESSTVIANNKNELNTIELQQNQLLLDLESKTINKKEYLQKIQTLDDKKTEITKNIKNIETRVEDIQLTQKEKLEKIVDKNTMQNILSNDIETEEKRIMLNKILDSAKLSNNEKEEYKKASESFINKTHGTLKEDDAIKMYEKKYKVKLDTSQIYHKKNLDFIKNSKYEWYIGGKVDGLYIDNQNSTNSYIVEVKNRTKGFFSTLRDYEKTQIQMYMWMLNLKQARLVEKKDEKIRNTKILYDDEYIENILEYLKIFIENFENKFLNIDTIKKNYITQSQDDKKKFLNKLYLTPIINYTNSKLLGSDLDSDNEINSKCEI